MDRVAPGKSVSLSSVHGATWTQWVTRWWEHGQCWVCSVCWSRDPEQWKSTNAHMPWWRGLHVFTSSSLPVSKVAGHVQIFFFFKWLFYFSHDSVHLCRTLVWLWLHLVHARVNRNADPPPPPTPTPLCFMLPSSVGSRSYGSDDLWLTMIMPLPLMVKPIKALDPK